MFYSLGNSHMKGLLKQRLLRSASAASSGPSSWVRVEMHVVWTWVSSTCLNSVRGACDATPMRPCAVLWVLKLYFLGLATIILDIVLVLNFCVLICTYVYCADDVLTCIEGHLVHVE